MFNTHNRSYSSTYISWGCMIQRCTNKKHRNYSSYGGRGITVCADWMDFENFYRDMGDRPNGMSLERKDNNGNYCKENCCWTTQKEQSNNTRTNVKITFNGETKTISQWAEATGIKRGTLNNRLFRGNWPLDKAFNPELRRGVKL